MILLGFEFSGKVIRVARRGIQSAPNHIFQARVLSVRASDGSFQGTDTEYLGQVFKRPHLVALSRLGGYLNPNRK